MDFENSFSSKKTVSLTVTYLHTSTIYDYHGIRNDNMIAQFFFCKIWGRIWNKQMNLYVLYNYDTTRPIFQVRIALLFSNNVLFSRCMFYQSILGNNIQSYLLLKSRLDSTDLSI